MLQDANLPLMAIVNDIENLIAEIDNNPQLSSWVVRLVLKSMRDKAKKMAIETAQRQAYLEELDRPEAIVN